MIQGGGSCDVVNIDEQIPEDLINSNTQQSIVCYSFYYPSLYMHIVPHIEQTKNKIVAPLTLREVVRKKNNSITIQVLLV